MKIYLTGAFSHRHRAMGYGEAAYQIYESLKKFDLDVKCIGESLPEDWKADIEFSFCHPDSYEFVFPNSYKIGYTAWESSEFMPSWWEGIAACDEIWTPSIFMSNVFRRQVPNKYIHVYQHGISEDFVPKKKKRDESKPFTFLSISEPYDRKDAQLIIDTFGELYGDNTDYKLILKCSKLDRTNKINPETQDTYSNIVVYTQYFTPEQMKHLYQSADVFVYPSWGEGWGIQPVEAMAMGIPTICTEAWADYRKYITLPIDSFPEVSPWQYIHPGFMLRPDRKGLKLAMKYAVSNYEEIANKAFKNSFEIHKDYNWEKVTLQAVNRFNEIYENVGIKKNGMIH